MKNLLSKIVICFCVIGIFAASASAISIDSFTKEQKGAGANGEVVDGPGAPPSVSGSTTAETPASTIIGGARTLESSYISGSPGEVKSLVSFGSYRFSNDTGVRGNGSIIWDGDTNTALNTAGLAGINFFQDNANAINVSISNFDYAGNKPVSLTITVYSSLNSNFATGTIVLNSEISPNAPASNSPALIKYYFQNSPGSLPSGVYAYTTFSGTGDLNQIFSNVGAITLSVVLDPLASASDLDIDSVTTDGDCELVPNADKKVKDACGVCGGTTKAGDILTACTDCLGVPYPNDPINGGVRPGESCTTGTPGVCTSGTYNSTGPGNCSCKSTTNPSSEICDDLDNDCDGATDEDFPQKGGTCTIGTAPCTENGNFVCTNAGGLTCNASAPAVQACENSKGCDGQPNSGLVRDICDVCGGDGKSCLGCDNQPFSGLTNDICNVCGGNGTSCLDCNNAPFGTAQLDRCGACNGDGQSCIKCTTKSQSPVFTLMDGAAKAQEAAVKLILRRLTDSKLGGAKIKRYISATKAKAHELQFKNWVLSWTTMPIENSQCDPSPFCTTVVFNTTLDTYRGRANELYKIGIDALNILKKTKGKKYTTADANLIKKVNSTFKKAIDSSNQAPQTHTTCTK